MNKIGAFQILLDTSKNSVSLIPINGDYSLSQTLQEHILDDQSENPWSNSPVKLETKDVMSSPEKGEIYERDKIKKSRLKRKIKNIFDSTSKKNKY